MASPVTESARGPRPLRLLLIEDSKDVLFLMRMELETLGYSVLTAQDAETGLEIAKREMPNVIISDIRMPGIDGLEFMKRVRMTPELASIPSIALTGYDTEGDVQAGLAAGYNAHLGKPVDPTELSQLIEKLVAGK